MLRRKQRLYKQAKKNNTWSNYTHYQHEIKRTIRKAEYNCLNNMIEEGLKNNDSKPFWRYIKSRKQDNIGVSPLKDRGTLGDSLQKANILLSQFQSVFTKEDSAFDTVPHKKSSYINYHHMELMVRYIHGSHSFSQLGQCRSCLKARLHTKQPWTPVFRRGPSLAQYCSCATSMTFRPV